MDAINPNPIIYDVGIQYNASEGYSESRVYRGSGVWEQVELVQNNTIKIMNGVEADKLNLGSATEAGSFTFPSFSNSPSRARTTNFSFPGNTYTLSLNGEVHAKMSGITGDETVARVRARIILDGSTVYTSPWATVVPNPSDLSGFTSRDYEASVPINWTARLSSLQSSNKSGSVVIEWDAVGQQQRTYSNGGSASWTSYKA
jgi:hypothetical protein